MVVMTVVGVAGGGWILKIGKRKMHMKTLKKPKTTLFWASSINYLTVLIDKDQIETKK
jgi:hypothetical protein